MTIRTLPCNLWAHAQPTSLFPLLRTLCPLFILQPFFPLPSLCPTPSAFSSDHNRIWRKDLKLFKWHEVWWSDKGTWGRPAWLVRGCLWAPRRQSRHHPDSKYCSHTGGETKSTTSSPIYQQDSYEGWNRGNSSYKNKQTYALIECRISLHQNVFNMLTFTFTCRSIFFS